MLSKNKAPELLNKRQTGDYLGKDVKTIQRLADDGTLPPVIQTARGSLWAKRDLDKLLGGVLTDKPRGQLMAYMPGSVLGLPTEASQVDDALFCTAIAVEQLLKFAGPPANIKLLDPLWTLALEALDGAVSPRPVEAVAVEEEFFAYGAEDWPALLKFAERVVLTAANRATGQPDVTGWIGRSGSKLCGALSQASDAVQVAAAA